MGKHDHIYPIKYQRFKISTMSILNKLFSSGARELTDSIGNVLDNVITNDEEKSKAKNELTEIVTSKLSELAGYQRDVIVQELKGNWLQRSWRPLVMLIFASILVAKWFGWTDPSIDISLEIELMSLLKIGIGGYIAGRSLEKISGTVTKNMDITFFKKKDRAKRFVA